LLGMDITEYGPSKLQESVTALYYWSIKWGMSFNPKKCMHMALGKNLPIFKLFMNGVAIPQTCGLKYLGVYIQSDLKCHGHTMNTVKKGNRLLAMIRRCLFSASTKTKMIAFNTVVWPVLEYASQVWSPYIKTIIDKVETVQRRAVKWAYRLGPVESVSECMIKNNI